MSRSTKTFVSFLGFIYLFCSYIHVCFQLVAFVREHVWHKALLIVNSLVFGVFSWLWVDMEVTPLFFLPCVYLNLLYPSFDFHL